MKIKFIQSNIDLLSPCCQTILDYRPGHKLPRDYFCTYCGKSLVWRGLVPRDSYILNFTPFLHSYRPDHNKYTIPIWFRLFGHSEIEAELAAQCLLVAIGEIRHQIGLDTIQL